MVKAFQPEGDRVMRFNAKTATSEKRLRLPADRGAVFGGARAGAHLLSRPRNTTIRRTQLRTPSAGSATGRAPQHWLPSARVSGKHAQQRRLN